MMKGLAPLADDPGAVLRNMPGYSTAALDSSRGATETSLNVLAFGASHRARCSECRAYCTRTGHQWAEDKDRVHLSVSPACYARRLLHSLRYGFHMPIDTPFAPWPERPRSKRIQAGRPGVDAAWSKMNRVPGAWIKCWEDGSAITTEHISSLMSASKVLDVFRARMDGIAAKLRLCFNAKPHCLQPAVPEVEVPVLHGVAAAGGCVFRG